MSTQEIRKKCNPLKLEKPQFIVLWLKNKIKNLQYKIRTCIMKENYRFYNYQIRIFEC